MAQHPFLSPAWLDEARKIGEEFRGAGNNGVSIKMNLVVNDVPFGEGSLNAHLDSTGGDVELEEGHLPEAEVTISVPYEVAKSILVQGDMSSAMQAFMGGHVKVDGDLMKLMALQGTGMPGGSELQARLQAITE